MCNLRRSRAWCAWSTRPGSGFASPAECQRRNARERRLAAAHIPERYRGCSLDTYEIYHEANPSLRKALQTARKFAETYPVDTAATAYFLLATAGLGKTPPGRRRLHAAGAGARRPRSLLRLSRAAQKHPEQLQPQVKHDRVGTRLRHGLYPPRC